MNANLLIYSRKAGALVWGTMFAAGLFSVNARADEWTKRTILTVKEPIQVTDTLLQPGTYVLRMIPNGTFGVDRHVVQIFNATETRIISTVLTEATFRQNTTGTTQFTWWETPPGTAKALRDWYFPGENTGDEFAYPKQPKQIAMWVPPPALNAPVPANAEPAPAAAPEPVESAAPAPADAAPETPPPAPEPVAAPPAPVDNSADRSAPAELPKTGSSYPLLSLCGFALAGLGGTLLLKRTA